MWRHRYVVSVYMRNTILPYPVLQYEIVLRVPVKITVQVLAAGCKLSDGIFYGFFNSALVADFVGCWIVETDRTCVARRTT